VSQVETKSNVVLHVDFERLRCSYDGLNFVIADKDRFVKMTHFEFLQLSKEMKTAIKRFDRDVVKKKDKGAL